MAGSDRWLYAWGFGYAAIGMASLLVPLYALTLGAGPLVIGGLASTAAFAGVPGALLWGWLAGRTGRRRVFVAVALGATAIILVVIPFVESIPVLVVLNASLWFVVSAAAPVLTLLVVEGYESGSWDRRIGRLNTYQGWGWVLGLVAGAVWIPGVSRLADPSVAERSLFVLGGLAAAIALPLALTYLPRERVATADRVARSRAAVARLAQGSGRVRTVPFVPGRLAVRPSRFRPGRLRAQFPRELWTYLLAVALFSAAFSAFWGPVPAYLGDAYADQLVFWLFVSANLTSAVCYAPVSQVATRLSPRQLQTGALVLRSVLFPLVPIVALQVHGSLELPVLLLVFGLIGATWAAIAVTAAGLVTRLAGTLRAEALGLYTALAGLGGGVGSIVGGWLAVSSSYQVAFLTAGVGVLASVGLVWTSFDPLDS